MNCCFPHSVIRLPFSSVMSSVSLMFQMTERIIFRPRTTRTVRCKCLFRPSLSISLCLEVSVCALSRSESPDYCLGHFLRTSFLTPCMTLSLALTVSPPPLRFWLLLSHLSTRSFFSSTVVVLVFFCRPLFSRLPLLQLDLSASEQQGGGVESGLQRGPTCWREQHCAGADQGHPWGGEEDDGKRCMLWLRSAQWVATNKKGVTSGVKCFWLLSIDETHQIRSKSTRMLSVFHMCCCPASIY